MKYEIYKQIKVADDFSLFDFISVGRKGHIPKRIEFTATDIPDIVNLAFGDIDKNGEIDDRCISDNGDRNRILATVAFVVDLYLSNFPDRWVYFKGSIQERTRLYRMAIGLNLEELAANFEIYGEMDVLIIPFQKNLQINGILVKKKSLILQYETENYLIQK